MMLILYAARSMLMKNANQKNTFKNMQSKIPNTQPHGRVAEPLDHATEEVPFFHPVARATRRAKRSYPGGREHGEAGSKRGT